MNVNILKCFVQLSVCMDVLLFAVQSVSVIQKLLLSMRKVCAHKKQANNISIVGNV